jgi:hypothetical protein
MMWMTIEKFRFIVITSEAANFRDLTHMYMDHRLDLPTRFSSLGS